MSHPAGHELPPDAEHFRAVLVQVLEARRGVHLAELHRISGNTRSNIYGIRMALLARVEELETIIHTHLREPQTPT